MKYIFVFLLLIAAPVRAQDCCRVEGVVLAASGGAIEGADVTLSSPDLKKPQVTKTAADGRYAFNGVQPGTRVEINVVADGRPIATGYTLVTDRVERLDIKAPPEIASPGGVEDLDPMGGQSAEVRGVVRAADGTPVTGASVVIAGTPVMALTDSAGRYSFGRVRAKLTVTLQVAAPGFKPAAAEITVPGEGATDSDVVLAPATADDAPAIPLARPAADRAAVTLTREAAAVVPRLMDGDVTGAAQFLPAAGTGLDESEVFVHGGMPDQARPALDGIALYPAPRLLAGLSAPFAPAVETAEIAATPRDAMGSAGTAGLLRLVTTTPASRPGGSADVGIFGPSAMLASPLGSAASITAGARWSWPESLYQKTLDRFMATDDTFVRDRSPVYQGGVLAPSPGSSFSALNGRFEARPGAGNRVTMSFYRADDAGNFSRDVAGPTSSSSFVVPQRLELPPDTTVQIGDVQSWSGGGVSAGWQRRWSSDFSTTATIARSRFTSDHAQSFPLTEDATAANLDIAFGRGGSDAVSEHDEAQDATVRITAALGIGFAHAVEAGVESTSLDAVYDARTEAGASLTTLLARSGTTTLWSAFAQDVWRPMASLAVSPGLRVTHDDLAGASYADPRVTASYAAAPGIVLRAGWSSEHQSISRLVREDREHGDGAFWTLADGTAVPVAHAQEASAGMSVQAQGVVFDAHAYYRTLDEVTMFAPRLLPGTSQPATGSGLYNGSGTAAAAEFLVQHHVSRNTLWASYAAGRAEYTFPALETGTFPASFDRLHQLKLVDSMRVMGGLSVTGAWRVASGKPYTQATAAEQVWFASGALAYQPVFQTKNSARLAPYHQLDLSSQFSHRTGPIGLTVGATVFNVYDRRNIAHYDYEAAGTTLITSQTLLTRRAADVFFKVTF